MVLNREGLKRYSSLLYISALVGIVVFGAARALCLFGRSLSIDEPWSANLVHLPLSQMWLSFHEATSQPFYYVLLKVWVMIFGESEVALRVPSLVFFVATLVAVALISRNLFGPFAGLVAAFLVSISDMGVVIAATARMYGLLGLLVALATLVAVRLLRLHRDGSPALPGSAGRRRDLGLWAAFVVLSTLGLLTHPIFGFFLIALSATMVLVSRRAVFLIASGVAAAVVLYFILWGPLFFSAAKLPATAWMTVPGWQDFAEGFQDLWVRSVPFIVALCLGLVGLLFQWRRVGQFAVSPAGRVLITMVVLSSLLPFAVSQWRPVYIATRTPIIFLPIICVLVSALVDFFRPRWVSVVVLLAVAFGAARASYSELVRPDPVPARESIAGVLRQAQCGDVVIAAALSYSEVNYYFRRLHAPDCLEIQVFPQEIKQHPGWLDDATVLNRPGAQDTLRVEAVALRELAQQSSGHTWVFYGASLPLTKVLRQELDSHLQPLPQINEIGSFFNKVLVYENAK